MKFNLAVVTFVVLAAVVSEAAIPVRQAVGEKRDHYLAAGVFVGGYDHGPMQLLNVRHSVNSTKVERLVLDVGAAEKDNTSHRPGFFHVAIQKKPSRVVIDLEDVSSSKVTPAQINKLLQKSPYFNGARVYQDPMHRNLTIELPLKTRVQIEVFELASEGKPGRIVMDVKGL